MNIYSLGYGTCEESQYWQYWHEQKFSKKEFQQIVQECTLAAYRRIEKHEPPALFMKTFQWVMSSEEFQEELIKRGFVKMEFTQEYSVFGCSAVDEPGDWSSYAGKETLQAQKYIKKEIEK